jgi:single-strand DNA-binding protein
MSGTFAHAQLLARTGADPEVRYTAEGRPRCRLSVAADRYSGKGYTEHATDWFTVILWDRLAEVAGEYVKKGARVFVDGRLVTRAWEDKGGRRHRTTEVVASQLILLDSPRAPAAAPAESAPAPAGEPAEGEAPP